MDKQKHLCVPLHDQTLQEEVIMPSQWRFSRLCLLIHGLIHNLAATLLSDLFSTLAPAISYILLLSHGWL